MMLMPFGRFKGKPVRSLPTWYLKWLCEQTWIQIPVQREAVDEFGIRYRKHMKQREKDEREELEQSRIDGGDEIRR